MRITQEQIEEYFRCLKEDNSGNEILQSTEELVFMLFNCKYYNEFLKYRKLNAMQEVITTTDIILGIKLAFKKVPCGIS